MAVLIVLAYLFVLLPLGVMWSGYVLSKLWAWFVVPALGVPELSIPAAIGLALIVSYMTHQATNGDDDLTPEALIEGVLWLAMRPAAALCFGWVIARWM